MEIAGRRLLEVGAPLRDEEQDPVFGCRCLDGAQRCLATDEEGHGDVGEHDDVAKRGGPGAGEKACRKYTSRAHRAR